MISISPNETVVFTAMRDFLRTILPSGDAVFTGLIVGGVLTVKAIDEGTIKIDDVVLGEGLDPYTSVTAVNGDGTFNVDPVQTVPLGNGPPIVMATGVTVIRAQDNRVPEPKELDFITMTMQRVERLSTNVESSLDVRFVGSIAGEIMTVTDVTRGAVKVGAAVFGVDVAAGSRVRKGLTGSGGVGTYRVSPAQTVASRVLSCGATSYQQATMLTVQLDVHGPSSSDHAQTITTMMRSAAAPAMFAEISAHVTPLHADDPRQVPFMNAENNYEDRWIVEAMLQVDYTVNVPQQFADEIYIGLSEVDATFPP